MKTLIVVAICLGLGLLCLGAYWPFVSGNDTKKLGPEDEKVQLVKDFWHTAEVGDNLDKFIAATPMAFYQADSKCDPSSGDSRTTVGRMSIAIKEDGFQEALREQAQEIKAKHLTLKDVRLYRELGDEAIVEARYDQDGDGLLIKPTYFFLYRDGGTWRIFSEARAPGLGIKHYASQDCTE